MDKRTKVWVTAGLMVGLLVSALDMTIVDTAFPRMIADLHGESIFTWVITVYMLAQTAIVPVVGKLADIYGRKIFYMLGMVLFLIGSMLSGASQSMTQLIAFRGLQGIGGGMLAPIAFTIIGDLFPGEQRAKMQGLFGGVFGLASIMGPKLGGWITHNFSWRWIFYINAPVGIVAIAIMFLAYKESRGERRPIDWIGSVTVVLGIVLFLLELAQGGTAWAWLSWQSFAITAGAVVSLGVFVYVELRVPEPVLDFALFKNRTFAVMTLISILTGAGMFGALVYIPWFIQGVVGVNPSQAGNVMTPMMMTVVIFSILSGRMVIKFPYRYMISAGFVIMAAAFLFMTRWTIDTTQFQATLTSMLLGVGLGLLMPILTLAMQNAFPGTRRGVVTSAATFFRQMGSTIGVTLFGAVFNHQMASQFQVKVAPQMVQLQPMLAKLPTQAQEFFRQVAESPQMLIRLLLSQDAQAAIPAPIRPSLLAGIKGMMVDSMQTVFWGALSVVVIGFVVVQFLGNTNLRQQAAEQGVEAVVESPIIAD